MDRVNITEPDDDEEPDFGGWDREKYGLMADYEHMDVGFAIEPYNPDKDPVNKGIVPSPYADKDES